MRRLWVSWVGAYCRYERRASLRALGAGEHASPSRDWVMRTRGRRVAPGAGRVEGQGAEGDDARCRRGRLADQLMARRSATATSVGVVGAPGQRDATDRVAEANADRRRATRSASRVAPRPCAATSEATGRDAASVKITCPRRDELLAQAAHEQAVIHRAEARAIQHRARSLGVGQIRRRLRQVVVGARGPRRGIR